MIKSLHTNTVFWFAEMSCKSVTRLTVADNPEERAPLYPGKWSRNNLNGSALSKNEYLEEKTSEWLEHVKNKEMYTKTSLPDKVKVLVLHLGLSSKKGRQGKTTNQQLKDFIASAELRLKEKEQSREKEGQGDHEMQEIEGEEQRQGGSSTEQRREDIDVVTDLGEGIEDRGIEIEEDGSSELGDTDWKDLRGGERKS